MGTGPWPPSQRNIRTAGCWRVSDERLVRDGAATASGKGRRLTCIRTEPPNLASRRACRVSRASLSRDRTLCPQSFIPLATLEKAVEDYWHNVRLPTVRL